MEGKNWVKTITCTQTPTTLILILLIRMSNAAEESISTIRVILSFLCSSLDIMCHPCLHNSQVPDPAFFANHADHKSESTAHKSCATEHRLTLKHPMTPLGRSCRTLGELRASPGDIKRGTSTVVLSSKYPFIGSLSQAAAPLCPFSSPYLFPCHVPEWDNATFPPYPYNPICKTFRVLGLQLFLSVTWRFLSVFLSAHIYGKAKSQQTAQFYSTRHNNILLKL